MVHVTVLFAATEGATFDHDYFRNAHLPMVRERMAPQLRRLESDQAMAGSHSGEEPAWMAGDHLYFESMADFEAAFGPNLDAVLGDLPNFTNVRPQVVISELTTW